ncbi:MAG: sigma-70 family RNA polymerase sigma factor [Nitrospirota bacterium]
MSLSSETVQEADRSLESSLRPVGADASTNERQLLAALRGGEEAAFASLVDSYHAVLLRLAKGFVRSHEVAEEVVQETWVGVLEGLDRFEGRSSLKTWIFRILINRAKTRGVRESRSVPFSSLGSSDEDPHEPAVDPARFQTTGPWVDHWASPPNSWDEGTPERLLLSKEAGEYLVKAIEALPPNQRQIILLRDVEGLDAKETCSLLEIGETNQRVLLHRARSKVRRALEQYLDGGRDKCDQTATPQPRRHSALGERVLRGTHPALAVAPDARWGDWRDRPRGSERLLSVEQV